LENTITIDVPSASAVPIPTSSVTANSFSFALHNVTDEVPQGRLSITVRPILELASHEAHDDVQPREVVLTQHEISVAAAPISQFVAGHDDVQMFRTEQTQSVNTNSPVQFSAAAAPGSRFEDHAEVNDKLNSTARVFHRENSPLLIRNIPHEEECIDTTFEEPRTNHTLEFCPR